VDQVRCFAFKKGITLEVPASGAKTLPHDDDVDLKIEALMSQFLMNDFINFWAAEIAGQGRRLGSLADSNLVNIVGGQPLVNPAFASLFWLAVQKEIIPSLTRAIELWSVVWDMIFDMKNYPMSRSRQDEVRRAQVDYVVDEVGVAIDVDGAVSATDEEWAATCERVLAERMHKLDAGLFTVIVREAGELVRKAGST
jgi:hypothetical protein